MDVSWYASLCRSFVNVYLVFLCVYYVWIAVNSKRICDKAHGLLCLPDCLPVFLYACLYISLSLSTIFVLIISLSIYMYVYLFPSLFLPVSPSLCLCMWLFLCLCLPLSLSLCLFLTELPSP